MASPEPDSVHRDSEDSLSSQGVRDAAALGAEGSRSEAALVSGGQRRVNLLWERTQAAIAITAVGTVLAIALLNAWRGEPAEIPEVLQNMVFLIIGAYFSRTNHEKIGGVGQKPPAPPYEGR